MGHFHLVYNRTVPHRHYWPPLSWLHWQVIKEQCVYYHYGKQYVYANTKTIHSEISKNFPILLK